MTKYAATRRSYNDTHQAEISLNKAVYYQANKTTIEARKRSPKYVAAQKVRSKRHYHVNKAQLNPKRAQYRMMREYGITQAQYDDMHDRQQGKCAICRQPEANRKLAVDHCHVTGKVRALLCGPCNKLLGVFEKHKDKFTTYLMVFG